jgi:hypothetical protein
MSESKDSKVKVGNAILAKDDLLLHIHNPKLGLRNTRTNCK